jgi:hypothetical protein
MNRTKTQAMLCTVALLALMASQTTAVAATLTPHAGGAATPSTATAPASASTPMQTPAPSQPPASPNPTSTPAPSCPQNTTCNGHHDGVPFNCSATECTLCEPMGNCWIPTPVAAPAKVVCICWCEDENGADINANPNSLDASWEFSGITDAANCKGKQGQKCKGYKWDSTLKSSGTLSGCALQNVAQ